MSHEYTLIVYTSPAAATRDEPNASYDDKHLPERTAPPGGSNGRRCKVTGDGKPQYAAIYELSSHPDAVMAAMNAGIKDGTVHMSDVIDVASVSMTTLTPR